MSERGRRQKMYEADVVAPRRGGASGDDGAERLGRGVHNAKKSAREGLYGGMGARKRAKSHVMFM